MTLSHHRQAAEQFEILLRNGKSGKSILDGLGFSYIKLGEYGRAIPILESSLRRYGEDPWIHSNLGYAHRCLSGLENSVEHYRRALKSSPEDPMLLHDLAFALYLDTRYEEASTLFQEALRRKPDWGRAHFNLAMTYWRLNQYPLALKHARAAQEMGVPEAQSVVETLSTHLTPIAPKRVHIRRQKN
jgi:tetratricopeptide (TPR) repeat protein